MGILSSLFGNSGSKSKSQSTTESGNKFAGQINDSFSPWIGYGTQGMGRAASILGGGQEGAQALDDWWNSSGGQFQLEQGLGDVNDKFHSLGLGRSGAAMKAMEGYRSDLASTKLNEYLGNLFNMNQQALGAGGLITNAGQYSKGQSSSESKSGGGGLGKAIGFGLSLFSDPRLKTNVVKVGEFEDGLGVYEYDYLPVSQELAAYAPPGRQRGVMADQVAKLRPWALGPEIAGFQTVNYGAL